MEPNNEKLKPKENQQQPEIEFIRSKLECAESSGFTFDTQSQILVESKSIFVKKMKK